MGFHRGDGCTDDSGEVVASFNDPRVIWHNLPENSGSQSTPNNTGINLARGRYIAYLGHDDVWHPTHLANLVAAMDAGADLAHSLLVSYDAPGTGTLTISGVDLPERLANAGVRVPPSGVMHRRDGVEEVGAWKDYRTIDIPPDTEFLSRWRGKKVVAVPRLTAFKFPSARRKNSYVEKLSREQAEMMRRIREEPDFYERELTTIVQAFLLNKPRPDLLHAPPKVVRQGWQVEGYRQLRGLDARPLPAPARRAYINFVLATIPPVRAKTAAQLDAAVARSSAAVIAFPRLRDEPEALFL